MRGTAKQLALFSDADEPDQGSGFSVRESARAKRLSIKVYPRGRVEVVVPKRTRPRDVQSFVDEHRDWIHRTRASYAEVHPPEPFALPRRIDLTAIGCVFDVRYCQKPGTAGVRYRQHRNAVVLSGNPEDERRCVDALKRWLAALAKREFEPRLQSLAALTGNGFARLQVRGQRTCWGSHSSTGTISLNYCLLFLEPAHLRYLMVHELCHARHMNHSRRFWRLVGRFEPGYRQLDRELTDAWQLIPIWLGIH